MAEDEAAFDEEVDAMLKSRGFDQIDSSGSIDQSFKAFLDNPLSDESTGLGPPSPARSLYWRDADEDPGLSYTRYPPKGAQLGTPRRTRGGHKSHHDEHQTGEPMGSVSQRASLQGSGTRGSSKWKREKKKPGVPGPDAAKLTHSTRPSTAGTARTNVSDPESTLMMTDTIEREDMARFFAEQPSSVNYDALLQQGSLRSTGRPQTAHHDSALASEGDIQPRRGLTAKIDLAATTDDFDALLGSTFESVDVPSPEDGDLLGAREADPGEEGSDNYEDEDFEPATDESGESVPKEGGMERTDRSAQGALLSGHGPRDGSTPAATADLRTTRPEEQISHLSGLPYASTYASTDRTAHSATPVIATPSVERSAPVPTSIQQTWGSASDSLDLTQSTSAALDATGQSAGGPRETRGSSMRSGLGRSGLAVSFSADQLQGSIVATEGRNSPHDESHAPPVDDNKGLQDAEAINAKDLQHVDVHEVPPSDNAADVIIDHSVDRTIVDDADADQDTHPNETKSDAHQSVSVLSDRSQFTAAPPRQTPDLGFDIARNVIRSDGDSAHHSMPQQQEFQLSERADSSTSDHLHDSRRSDAAPSLEQTRVVGNSDGGHDLRATVLNLRLEVQRLEGIIEAYERESADALTKLQQVEQSRNSANDAVALAEQRWNAERISLREKVTQLEQQLGGAGLITDTRVVDLQTELDDLRLASDFDAKRASTLRQTISDLETKVGLLESENSELRTTVEVGNREAERLLTSESTLRSQVDRLSEQLATAQAGTQATEAEPAARLEANSALKERYDSMREQYQSRIQELELQLEGADRVPAPKSHRPYSRVKDLELELRNSATAYKAKIAELEEQVRYAEAAAAKNTGYTPRTKNSGHASAKKIAELHEKLEATEQQAVARQEALSELEAQFADYKASVGREIDVINAERESSAAELQRLRGERALHQADDSSIMLQRKVESLEKVIEHLNERLVGGPSMETIARYDAQLRDRDRQLDVLHEKLALAKKHHSPTLVHFERLESTVVDLEARLRRREREFEALATESKFSAEAEVAACEKRWRAVVVAKQAQIDKFRLELDKILEAIRIMQQQGVRFQVPISV